MSAGHAAIERVPSVAHREHGGPLFQKLHAQQFKLITPAGTQSWTYKAFGGVKSWKLDGVTQFEVTEIDFLGRPLEIEDASGTREIEYDNDKWTLNTVEWTDGPMEGFKLDEDTDTRGRLGTLTVSKNFDDLYSVTHTYRGDSDRIDTLTVTTTGAPAVAIDVNGPGGMADQFNYTVNGQNTHTYSRSRNANGRLNGVSAPGFSQSWNLDAMGRVKDLTTNGKTTTHGYHPINGSLASAVSADEAKFYTFTDRGELQEEILDGEELWAAIAADQSGAIIGRENLRELKIYGTFHTNAVVNVLVGTNVVHNTAVTPFEFTFDETTLPALTDTNAVVSLDWSVVGTRPEEPGGTPYEGGNAVAEIAGEHLFAPQAESVTYDIATRRASDAFLNYGWDAANQPLMLEERHGPHRTEHDYDGSQRRVEKRVYHNGNLRHTHRFVYDGWLPVVEEVEDQWGNFAYRNLYVWGPGPGGTRQTEIGATGQLALIIHQPKHGPPQLSAPIYNHRLDVVGLVDVESGQVVARYGYTPFGKTTYAIGPRADQNPFRFAGAYWDDETETYYFGYRHYHPRTKQWISRDPIGEAGGLNLFAYANNEPINQGPDVLGLALFDSPAWTFRARAWFQRKLGNENRADEIMQDLAWQDAKQNAGGIKDPLMAFSPAHATMIRRTPPHPDVYHMHFTMRTVERGSVGLGGTTFAGIAFGTGTVAVAGPSVATLYKTAKAEAVYWTSSMGYAAKETLSRNWRAARTHVNALSIRFGEFGRWLGQEITEEYGGYGIFPRFGSMTSKAGHVELPSFGRASNSGLPRTLAQQREISLLTTQARNDLAGNFDELAGALTERQIMAVADEPWRLQLYFGNAVESRVAGRIDNIVSSNSNSILSDLSWTGRTNAPQDFIGSGGFGFDITGGSKSSMRSHFNRAGIDSVITYESIPSILGYDFIRYLDNL